jgi:microcystin-dependent protein
MSQPYVGQILMFGGNFAPAGWMFCAGQLIPISENETLFNLIGTTYGGDGQSTFALPDLRGRAPVHMGQGQGLSNYTIGEPFGVEQVTLTTQQIPGHNHTVNVLTGTQGNQSKVANNVVLSDELTTQSSALTYVNNTANSVALGPKTIGPNGGSQPHENHQPLLVINYIISMFGVYPSPT